VKQRFLVLLSLLLLGSFSLMAQEVSLEEIQALIDAEEFENAIEALDTFIDNNPNDLQAKRLRRTAQAAINQEQSARLTEEALFLVEEGNFEESYLLLEQALRLDPNNSDALNLFTNLQEVVDTEKLSQLEEQRAAEAAAIAALPTDQQSDSQQENQTTDQTGTTSTQTDGETNTTTDSSSSDAQTPSTDQRDSGETGTVTDEDSSTEGSTEQTGSIFDGTDKLFVQVPLGILISGTDLVQGLETGLVLGNLGVGVTFSPGLLGNFLEFFASYDIAPFTLSGDERVSYTIHKIQVQAMANLYLFPIADKAFVISPRAGFQYFNLNNSAESGFYYFTEFYAPIFGVRLMDPVFARFIEADGLSNLGLGLSLDFAVIPAETSTLNIWNFAFFVEWEIVEGFALSLNNELALHTDGSVSDTFYNLELIARLQLAGN
jgi:hypothetical protein